MHCQDHSHKPNPNPNPTPKRHAYEVCLIPSAVLDNAPDPMNLGISKYGLRGLVLVVRVRVDLVPLICAKAAAVSFSFSLFTGLHGAFYSRHAVLAQCTSSRFECTYVCMPPH